MINDNNDIRLKVFCFPITLKCNLKCKLCGAHSPYYKKPYHPTKEDLQHQLDDLFQLVSFIDKFDIGGGEPFLRIDLAEIISYLQVRYRNKIGHIRIITNGTMLPPDNVKNGFFFINEALPWRDDFFIIVDKYPVKFDKSDEIATYLKKAGIRHEIRDYTNNLHCGGWVDFGDLSLKHDDDEAKKLFKKCSVPRQGFFTSLVDGKIFPCGRARILYEKGIGEDYIDISDIKISITTKQQQFIKLLSCEYLKTCKYCNGMSDDSVRFLPAEQLI